jgi:hypothetical protein
MFSSLTCGTLSADTSMPHPNNFSRFSSIRVLILRSSLGENPKFRASAEGSSQNFGQTISVDVNVRRFVRFVAEEVHAIRPLLKTVGTAVIYHNPVCVA